MTQQTQSPAFLKRRKLLIQLLAFIALAIVLYASPKIEAWVQQQQAPVQTQSAGTSNSGDASDQSRSRKDARNADSNRTATEEETADDAFVALNNEEQSAEPSTASEPSSDEQERKTKSDEQPKSEEKTDPGAGNKESSGNSKKSDSSKKKSGGKGSVVPMNREAAPRRTAGDAPGEATDKDAETTPEWGKLREIRNNVFESTAGLVYRSGSVDGHRLKHVMKHARDDLSKPVHGVFVGEGDRDIVLALIDEAFDKAQKGGKDVRKEEEGDRTVLTVNMKKPVGFTGGQEGKRRNNPECRFIRIVVERENEVISAYPTSR